MSHNWGYVEGKKNAKDMGLSAKAPRVEVKTHTRAPRVTKAPPVPKSPAKDTPVQAGMKKAAVTAPVMQAFAKGGAVKKSAGKSKPSFKKKGC